MISLCLGNSRYKILRRSAPQNDRTKHKCHSERSEESNFQSNYQRQSKLKYRCIKVRCLLIILFLFTLTSVSFAQGNIVDYFLKSPEAWDKTKRLIHKEPTKIIIAGGLEGLGFNLADLTEGDEVALVFIDTRKSEKMKRQGFCKAEDKLLQGKNRVVSVITRNSGNRTQFHYKFLLQRNINNEPITIYNNGNAVLESTYDGSKPVVDISNLSGIELCEIEIHDW
ncbi:MAG: hypothetical protein HYV59_09190 [Planctomycetes bacterium]|nr:hypothetical protein [Planctomycetota bacterium]